MPHHKNLAIHPAPFKSSHLSIPPSPFSPRSPLTPVPKSLEQKQKQTTSFTTATISTPPPAPTSPLQWVWTCHACTRAYPLGATRRCLDDGHRFCAGTTAVKSWRKDGAKKRVKRHRACGSEFDYLGWKTWGRWRRRNSHNAGTHAKHAGKSVKPLVLGLENEKNCWDNCDYPSQCRWGKRVGIHTPTPTRTEFATPTPSSEPWTLNTPMADMPTLSDCFAAEDDVPDEKTSVGALGRLLQASAKRRKSVVSTPASPLGSDVSAADVEMQDVDVITPLAERCTPCVDPSLLVLSNTPCVNTYTDTSSSYTSHPSSTTSVSSSKASATIQRIKALLSNHKTASPRQISFPPVAKQQQGSRQRRAAAPMVVVPQERRDSEALVDEFLALEAVARWNAGVVKVS